MLVLCSVDNKKQTGIWVCVCVCVGGGQKDDISLGDPGSHSQPDWLLVPDVLALRSDTHTHTHAHRHTHTHNTLICGPPVFPRYLRSYLTSDPQPAVLQR